MIAGFSVISDSTSGCKACFGNACLFLSFDRHMQNKTRKTIRAVATRTIATMLAMLKLVAAVETAKVGLKIVGTEVGRREGAGVFEGLEVLQLERLSMQVFPCPHCDGSGHRMVQFSTH